MGKYDIRCYKNEIKINKMMDHPNIVNFIEDFENEKYYLIVMELLEGGNLLTSITNTETQNFNEFQAMKVVKSLTEAVVFCHGMGVVHRDIKLENMLLTKGVNDKSFQIKLCDFGLSKYLAKGDSARECCGTLTYCAPEILKKRPYNHTCDFWSIGVVMYTLLTGF